MSVLSITSVAIALARKAAGTPAATGDAELGGQLDDLVIHLSQLRNHCVLLMDENRTLRRTAGEADEPCVVVGN